MLKYDTRALLEEKFTYYELVIAVAKRARAIADQAELEHEALDVKPVRMAIDELQKSRAHIQHIELPQEESSVPAEAPASFAGLGSAVDFSDDGEEDEENADDEDFDDEDEEDDASDASDDDAEA